MTNALWSWWLHAFRQHRRPRPWRRPYALPPCLERLESRIVFAVGPTPLPFTAFQTAHTAGFLATPNAFDLYQVQLNAGDVVNASVSSQASGGALQSSLRVFNARGQQVALDDQQGGDPRLTFQAPAAGSYLVGVSSAGDDAYNPSVAGSGQGGSSTGLYSLDLRRTSAVPLTPDLAGSSFRLQSATAAYGESVSGTFSVDNRGGAAAGPFAVQVLLSADNLFGPQSLVLTTLPVAGLGPGQAFTPGSFTVTLPDLASATAAGLPVSGPVYLGLRIDPAGVVPELNPNDQSGVHRGEDWQTLTVVTPVVASGSNHSPASADVLGDLNSRVSGVLTPGQQDWYQVTVPAAERLTAQVAAVGGSGLVPRLTLTGPDGQVLIQSDDGSLVQYLQPGTYEVAVAARSGAGRYQLTTEFIQAGAPLEPLPVGAQPSAVVMADVNGDGIPDIVTLNFEYGGHSGSVSVLLGNGNGTFQPARSFSLPAASYPNSVAVADVNGDGKPDIITANNGSNNVSVLLGNGDGSFQAARTFAEGSHPMSVAVADVNGDGKPDLIVSNFRAFNPTTGKYGNSSVSILLGKGDGTFGAPQTFDDGSAVNEMAVADVNGDGKPDLIVSNKGTTGKYDNSSVNILLGNGDGTFQPPQTVPAAPKFADGVTVADVNGDGKPDLVVSYGINYNNVLGVAGVSVLLGNGDGTFRPEQTYQFGNEYVSVVADVNGDGKPDLVTLDGGGSYSTVSVLLGNGDGTFQNPQPVALGDFGPVAVADVNGDGKADLVTPNHGVPGSPGNTVSVLLGNGDGTFQLPQTRQTFPVGAFPTSVAVVDLNGDSIPDIVTANRDDGTVSVLLGNGDGTFQKQRTFAAGSSASGGPFSVAVADVNGDGKPDIITANSDGSGYPYHPGTVSVLLGNGDGTFQPQQTFPVNVHNLIAPLAVADVNGDGKPDIITDSYSYHSHGYNVNVLLGNGDGTFQPQQTFPVGVHGLSLPLAAADFNGDGKPDIVVANFLNHTFSVLLGNGDGTFQAPQTFPVFPPPTSVAVADVNGDGKPDLVTANADGTAGVLLGNGDGTFQNLRTFAAGSNGSLFRGVAVADLNGDGKPDIVVPNRRSNTVRVLLGNGDGTFQPPQAFPVGVAPLSLAVADVNGDGKPDLVVANAGSGDTVLLGNGDGTFTPVKPSAAVGRRNTPYLADLTGGGLPDSVVLSSKGDILLRQGLPGSDNTFAPPVILNPGRPARDLTLVNTASGPAIATADASFDPTLSGANHFVYTISLYTVAPNGKVNRSTAFSTTLLPTRIAAADLTGNGLDDLVVANSLDNSIQIAFQQPDGTFSAPITRPTGEAPSDLSLVDLSGDGQPDIVVSNQASGDVSVFPNDSEHAFSQSYRFRAGTGLYGLDTSAASPTISTLEQSVSLTAGDFTGSGRNDLVVVNRGSDSFSVLPNDGSGGFANPQPALTTSTSDGFLINAQPGPIVAGDFNGPNQPLDLALLMKDRQEVWIYSGNGDGTFSHTFSIPAGASPTGLNLVRNSQTGLLDLLVGNPFGDVLHLQGKGDGTFQVAGNHASLAVQNLGNGKQDVLVANQQSDRISIQAPQSGSARFSPVVTLADGSHSTLAPGAVQWAKLDKASPYYDAVVVASGGNEVLVYRGTGFDAAGNPTFAAPVSYSVGTNPVAVTIQDINGDGIPDMLVADQGSNDVSTLFGSWDSSGNWLGTAGPRLNSGGAGPVAVTVLNPTTPDGNPSLLVTNGQSGTMTVLPGVGKGFFNDQNPKILNLPGNPVLTQGPSFFDASSGVVVAATGQLLGFDINSLSASTLFTPPAGEEVAAAQALADGHVVAALANGTVVDLTPTNDVLAEDLVFAPQGGLPAEPSALEVLQGESGMQVLVTEAGGDGLFVFALPGLTAPGLPPAEASAGPTVEVTPPSAGSLTLVVTLTAVPVSPTVAAFAEVAAEESLPAAPAGGVSVAATAVAAVAARSADPAGDAEGEAGREQVAEAELPRPIEQGLDVEEKLRQIDLYQPTPNPDRPGPMSHRPARRDQELLALAPVALTEPAAPPLGANVAEVVEAVIAELREAAPTPTEAADAVFLQPPLEWTGQPWRLLALAGVACWPWSDHRPDPSAARPCRAGAAAPSADPERQRLGGIGHPGAAPA
jgi:microcystin-dependent protein